MSISINDIHAFFDDQLSSPVNIWCEDPETQKERVGGIFGIEKSYLTYRILMKQIGRDILGVRHRYSEFESMRTVLNERYSILGIMVPALPPKNQVTSILNKGSDGIFVKERTLGLSFFCEAIVANPFLRNDNLWKDFMRPTSQDGSAPNTGHDMLTATFSFMDLPFRSSMDQKMADLKEEINCIEKHAKVALDKAKSLQAAERSVQQASEAFHCSMQAWTDVEASVVKHMNGKLQYKEANIIPEMEQVPNTLRKLTSFFISKHVACDDTPDYESVFLIACLEHEIARMESMKELFKVHDAMKSNIEQINSKLMKAESGRSGKSGLDSIPALKQELSDYNKCLEAFYKGLVYFTLPMCCRLRTANFRRASNYMVSSFVSVSTGLQNACFKFLVDCKVSVQDSNNDANAVLSLLSMKPFANFPTEFPIVEDPLAAPEPPFQNLFAFALEGTRAATHTVTQTKSSIDRDYNYSGDRANGAAGGGGVQNSNNSSNTNNSNSNSSSNNSAPKEDSSSSDKNNSTSSPSARPPSASIATVPVASIKSYEATEKSNSLLSDLTGGQDSTAKKEKGLWD